MSRLTCINTSSCETHICWSLG